ncbi:MAG TPA: hypothetical protein VEU96_06010 [Bryobacteraceae bacterium]|nr:hypothetical protein [Bryobacteraceae bacterium]
MNRLVGLLALLLTGYSVVMMLAVWGFPKEGPRYEIGPPVLTLELAASGEELSNLLDAKKPDDKDFDARTILRHDTHLDNFYIPTYTAFFLSFIWMIGGGAGVPVNKLATAAFFAGVVAGVADGIENYHIFAALRTSEITDATAAAIRSPSLVKWANLDVMMLLMAILLFQRMEQPFSRRVNVLLAALTAAAAVVGFCGLAYRPLIPLSSLLSAGLPLASLSLLWRKQKES